MSQNEPDSGPPGDFTINLGGPDGGGDGSSSSSGGSSGGGGDPLGAYRSTLLTLRINPAPFIGLMQQAAGQNWTSAEFMWALESNPRFIKMFPGITQLLDEGMSVSGAVAAWRRLGQEYKEAAQEMGAMRTARLNPEKVGFLIEHNVDLDEFKLRLGILQYARHTEGARQAFNAVLKKRGDDQLDKQGWYRFIMGRGEQRLYDTYEGALLMQELGPSGLRARQARHLGKIISGADGTPAFDASSIAKAFQEVRNALGSQVLKDAHISAKDLALGVLGGSDDIHLATPRATKRALAARDKLEQLAKNVQGIETAKEGGATLQTQSGRPLSAASLLP
jgi:hypothetical protein